MAPAAVLCLMTLLLCFLQFTYWDMSVKRQQTKTPLSDDIDITLWESLRECRRGLAEEQGVPPYVIFHDRSLKEMCIALPCDLLQFEQITGVGERKLKKYGTAFLEVINDFLQDSHPQPSRL